MPNLKPNLLQPHIQLMADNQLDIKAGNELVISASKVTIDCANTSFSGNVTIQGNVVVSGSSLTHGGTNIGKDHKHGGVQGGPGTTTPPM